MQKRKSTDNGSYQCALFTTEQMQGTGQLNLIDQIERDAEVEPVPLSTGVRVECVIHIPGKMKVGQTGTIGIVYSRCCQIIPDWTESKRAIFDVPLKSLKPCN